MRDDVDPESAGIPYHAIVQTPIGPLGIRLAGALVCGIDFLPETYRVSPQDPNPQPLDPARIPQHPPQDPWFLSMDPCFRWSAQDSGPQTSVHRPQNTAAATVLTTVVAELIAYFHDPHTPFTVPYLLSGTPFQQRVWHVLRTVPAGTTITYGALAQQLGTAARAVGKACSLNPLPLIIPCHRVVGKKGLVGYTSEAGDPLAIKTFLLQHEGALPKGDDGL